MVAWKGDERRWIVLGFEIWEQGHCWTRVIGLEDGRDNEWGFLDGFLYLSLFVCCVRMIGEVLLSR